MRLPDDAIAELWTLYDLTGLRPEYVLPVLAFESGFNPAAPNAAGFPYYGIAQDYGGTLEAHGLSPGAYLAMSAAEQLRAIVVPRLSGFVHSTSILPESATRVYQANFLPASLPRSRFLWSPLALAGSAVYKANAFDVTRRGAIIVGDLARAMAKAAARPDTQAAIARAYQIRPSAGAPRDPVFGDDFAIVPAWLLAAIVGVAGAATARAVLR